MTLPPMARHQGATPGPALQVHPSLRRPPTTCHSEPYVIGLHALFECGKLEA
jgi:hypothetical protein